MSKIFKSNNITIQSPFNIKNISTEELNINNINSAIEDERLDLTKREEFFNIQLEQKKKELFERTQIEARVSANKISEKIVENAKNEAETLLDNAHKTLEEAKQNSELITNEAYNKGFEKGMNDAQEYINQANSMLQSVTDERKKIISNMKSEIIDLIVYLFEKTVGYKLENDDKFMVALVENTLAQFGNKNAIVVKVSSEDYEMVNSKKSDILSALKNIDGFTLLAQDSLLRGDCIVETNSGEIDSSIPIQLAHIKNIIKDVLKNDLDGES